KWSLEVERGLWRNSSITLGYAGDSLVHGWVQNGSANAYAPGFAGLPATAPDPAFGTVTIQQQVGKSNYNGGYLNFVDRFGSNVIQINYTYSHALTDEIGTSSPMYIEDPYDPMASYGNANFDVRNDLTANYVYTVPFTRLSFAPQWLAQGWQISGTITAHSGLPYTVWASAENAALAASNYASSPSGPAYGIFANFHGGTIGSCSTPSTPCLSSSQFSSAAGGFGAQALNQFHGPAYIETDFGLMKFTNITESMKFGFGAQAFNLFNHPNFAVPDSNLADPTFGQILNAVGSPSSIYGVLGSDNSPRLVQLKLEFSF
ncbi:MAG: hypothetical protein ACRD1Y_09945, partial [Terriglobales bacterium]